jgi:hypothetical protein
MAYTTAIVSSDTTMFAPIVCATPSPKSLKTAARNAGYPGGQAAVGVPLNGFR